MSEFETTFAELRVIMLDAAPGCVVARDEPGDLVIHTRRVEPKSGKPEWFGAVTIKKTYVAYHLFPLYTTPSIGEGMSDALTKRRQGKSCFNFKAPEPVLFAELAALTERAAGQG